MTDLENELMYMLSRLIATTGGWLERDDCPDMALKNGIDAVTVAFRAQAAEEDRMAAMTWQERAKVSKIEGIKKLRDILGIQEPTAKLIAEEEK